MVPAHHVDFSASAPIVQVAKNVLIFRPDSASFRSETFRSLFLLIPAMMSAFAFTSTGSRLTASGFLPGVCMRRARLQSQLPRKMRRLNLSVAGEEAVLLVDESLIAKRARLAKPDPAHCERLGRPLVDMIMQADPTCTAEDVNIRVYQYYIPIYLWALRLMEEHKLRTERPLILGFSCPQVCTPLCNDHHHARSCS